MAQNLAPIYLDNDRVRLQGDPRPTVKKILDAGGKNAQSYQVLRLESKEKEQGETLSPQDVIDRTEDTKDVYLKTVESGGTAGKGQMGQPGGQAGQLRQGQQGGPSGQQPQTGQNVSGQWPSSGGKGNPTGGTGQGRDFGSQAGQATTPGQNVQAGRTQQPGGQTGQFQGGQGRGTQESEWTPGSRGAKTEIKDLEKSPGTGGPVGTGGSTGSMESEEEEDETDVNAAKGQKEGGSTPTGGREGRNNPGRPEKGKT